MFSKLNPTGVELILCKVLILFWESAPELLLWVKLRKITNTKEDHTSQSTANTYTMTCAHSEDSDQPAYLCSVIRVFPVCMKKLWVSGYRLCSQTSDQTTDT